MLSQAMVSQQIMLSAICLEQISSIIFLEKI